MTPSCMLRDCKGGPSRYPRETAVLPGSFGHTMSENPSFTKVEFFRFKAFERFTLNLRHFNVLVGPNNAGKSTILAAFRILAAAMRKAQTKKPEMIRGPQGRTHGHRVDLSAASVAEENIFFNYDDSEPAIINFHLSNKASLTLYFPESGSCYLIPESTGRTPLTPSAFKAEFNAPIGFVPILGPVEHRERLYEKEAARLALFNYRAARNFRNIWFHYPERFNEFREALINTWPGMDIEKPQMELSRDKPLLYMFCLENRVPRELFWSGFGFQVWCQMLTHLTQWKHASVFLIDEPDIYLHSDLQRQLIGILRTLGPDIILATHSTEMITESETDDIVLINKKSKSSKRIQQPTQLNEIFKALGSSLNPVLTQLAKTKKVIFVEGEDFRIISKIAKKIGCDTVSSRRDFAVIPIEGFAPERLKNLVAGMEATLGSKLKVGAILDRDFRSSREITEISRDLSAICDFVQIHNRKEIENYLLVPPAIDRAVLRKISDQARRGGAIHTYKPAAANLINSFANEKRGYVLAQLSSNMKRFERERCPHINDATIIENAYNEFDVNWGNDEFRISAIPGKDAIGYVTKEIQDLYGISLTLTSIIEAMHHDEIPEEMAKLIIRIREFASN